MKTPVLSRRLVTAVTLMAVLDLLPPTGLAAEKAVTPKKGTLSAVSEAEGYELWIHEGVFIHRSKKVEPTLGNVVDALRERYTDANIALAPGLAELRISDLKLRAGQLADELEAIRVASGSKFEWMAPGSAGPNLPPGSSGLDPATGLPFTASPPPEARNSGLFILREPPSTPWNERTVEAFNLTGYIQWLTDKDKDKTAGGPDSRAKAAEQSLHDIEKIVLETIETFKQGNLNSQDQPRFQFHRGANLLVAIGTRESVEIVRKVVNALPGQAETGSPLPGGFGGGPTPNQAHDAFKQPYRDPWGNPYVIPKDGIPGTPAPGAPGTAPR